VLRIQDVHPGSEFFLPRTRIQGPKAADPNPQQRMQVLRKSGKTLILDSLKYDLGVYLGSRIRIFFHPGSRIWILDPGVWILDPQHCLKIQTKTFCQSHDKLTER